MLIAGVAVTALVTPSQSAASATGPALPAAVVNLDQMVQVEQNGTETPFLAGKLLVSELTSGTSGQGFTWNVTDADTASSGLESGRFAAVVTIPPAFSASYVSISSTDPVQAQLQVQTNGANSYVTEMLASALSSDLQAALSTQATKQFVSTTLGAFTTLNASIGQAATAADELAGGAGKLSTGADQLATGSAELATGMATAARGGAELDTGAQSLAGGLATISAATTDLPTYAQELADGTGLVEGGIGLLRVNVGEQAVRAGTMAGDQRTTVIDPIRALAENLPDDPEAIRAELLRIEGNAAAVRDTADRLTLGLAFDTLGGAALEYGAGVVRTGQQAFADDLPQLTDGLARASSGAAQLAVGTSGLATGLGQLSSGAAQLASGTAQLAPGAAQLASGTAQLAGGLHQATAAIPTYTTDQQAAISTVVSTPIVTRQSDIAALPSPAAAIAAVAVPMALWIGAFAIYLMLTPFTRRALASSASTVRVVIGSLVPAVVLGLVQAAIVALVLFFVGAAPAHVAGSIAFSLFMSFAFVTLHQGLVALFGQAGRLLSLALVLVQVAAAAVIIPNGLSSPFYTGLSTLLPLSHAITGMQALIGGGSAAASVAGQEALVLLVFAAIGLALSLIAVTRRRSQSLIVLAELRQSALPRAAEG
ncbi:YhgE/Pip family protein [Herbiconiux daphne]|uniref:YhgE/Pip family protein n=1 Tax=Herbiconiux daphne TaxID=2970914 RepID=A0ABT2H675_9MICO|nr:YhgE/Pip family protein [Herbiconiux daphne]MCS5735422.1 YhgE/Pip family protein [Herbiconiux daphne]